MKSIHRVDEVVRQARLQDPRPTQPLFTDCAMAPGLPVDKSVVQLYQYRRQSHLPPHYDQPRQGSERAVHHQQPAKRFPPAAVSQSGACLPDTDMQTGHGFSSANAAGGTEMRSFRDVAELQLALGEGAKEGQAEDAEGNDGIVLKGGCTCRGCYIPVEHDQYEYQVNAPNPVCPGR